jgi:hypothetical protein
MNPALKLIIYFRIAYLLHLVTVLEILLIIYLFSSQWFLQVFVSVHILLKIILALVLAGLPLMAQLDARSRYQNYKLLRDQFYFYGFQPRIVRPFAPSRCQRDAVKVAASQVGYSSICNRYFYDLGYRWYHVLPDFVIKNPAFLFYKKFWLTTLFVKYYPSRVGYKNVCAKKQELLLHLNPGPTFDSTSQIVKSRMRIIR